jgi:hypothetical protein
VCLAKPSKSTKERTPGKRYHCFWRDVEDYVAPPVEQDEEDQDDQDDQDDVEDDTDDTDDTGEIDWREGRVCRAAKTKGCILTCCACIPAVSYHCLVHNADQIWQNAMPLSSLSFHMATHCGDPVPQNILKHQVGKAVSTAGGEADGHIMKTVACDNEILAWECPHGE